MTKFTSLGPQRTRGYRMYKAEFIFQQRQCICSLVMANSVVKYVVQAVCKPLLLVLLVVSQPAAEKSKVLKTVKSVRCTDCLQFLIFEVYFMVSPVPVELHLTYSSPPLVIELHIDCLSAGSDPEVHKKMTLKSWILKFEVKSGILFIFMGVV